MGEVFFTSMERLLVSRSVQSALIIANYVHLMPLKLAQIIYNELVIGIILCKIGVDSPLNVISMLRFSMGTKKIMTIELNTTII